MELLIPLLVAPVSVLGFLYTLLALSALDERQSIPDVIRLRLKTIRMRMLVKCRMRRQEKKPDSRDNP